MQVLGVHFHPRVWGTSPWVRGWGSRAGSYCLDPDSHNALRSWQQREKTPACCLQGLKSSGPLSRKARHSALLPQPGAFWLCSKGTREDKARQGVKGRWGTHGCQVLPSGVAPACLHKKKLKLRVVTSKFQTRDYSQVGLSSSSWLERSHQVAFLHMVCWS